MLSNCLMDYLLLGNQESSAYAWWRALTTLLIPGEASTSYLCKGLNQIHISTDNRRAVIACRFSILASDKANRCNQQKPQDLHNAFELLLIKKNENSVDLFKSFFKICGNSIWLKDPVATIVQAVLNNIAFSTSMKSLWPLSMILAGWPYRHNWGIKGYLACLQQAKMKSYIF